MPATPSGGRRRTSSRGAQHAEDLAAALRAEWLATSPRQPRRQAPTSGSVRPRAAIARAARQLDHVRDPSQAARAAPAAQRGHARGRPRPDVRRAGGGDRRGSPPASPRSAATTLLSPPTAHRRRPVAPRPIQRAIPATPPRPTWPSSRRPSAAGPAAPGASCRATSAPRSSSRRRAATATTTPD